MIDNCSYNLKLSDLLQLNNRTRAKGKNFQNLNKKINIYLNLKEALVIGFGNLT